MIIWRTYVCYFVDFVIDALVIPVRDVDQVCSNRANDDSEHEGRYCIKALT